MPSIEPTADQMAAFAEAPVEGPIVMVNLLRFRPDGGAESYARYAELVGPLLQANGARVVFRARGRATLIGPEGWDEVLLVEYPSRDAFLAMVSSEAYREAVGYRTKALLDSRLYCSQPG